MYEKYLMFICCMCVCVCVCVSDLNFRVRIRASFKIRVKFRIRDRVETNVVRFRTSFLLSLKWKADIFHRNPHV